MAKHDDYASVLEELTVRIAFKTFQAQIWNKKTNIELQQNFRGSYKKKSVVLR